VADKGELKPKYYSRARIFLTLGWYQNTVALIIENFIPHETNDSCRYPFAESASSDAIANADSAGDFRFEICMAAKVDDLASAEAVVVVNQLGDYVC